MEGVLFVTSCHAFGTADCSEVRPSVVSEDHPLANLREVESGNLFLRDRLDRQVDWSWVTRFDLFFWKDFDMDRLLLYVEMLLIFLVRSEMTARNESSF